MRIHKTPNPNFVLARVMKEKRIEQGKTQTEVAIALGITLKSVQLLEVRQQVFTLDKFAKVIRFFNLTDAEIRKILVGDEYEEMPEDKKICRSIP